MQRVRSYTSGICAAAWPCILGAVTVPAALGGSDGAPTEYVAVVGNTSLRIARSNDGLKFEDSGIVLLEGAAGPDLLRTPDGGLLLVCDYMQAGPSRENGPAGMALTRSRDGGRTWSPLRNVELVGPRARRIRALHGDLVTMPDQSIRMFFAATARRNAPRARHKPRWEIRSAVWDDGGRFRLDELTRVLLPVGSEWHPTTAWFGERVHLFAATPEPPPAQDDDDARRRGIVQAISRDGRRFARVTPPRFSKELAFIGNLVDTPEGARAYVHGVQGIISLTSKDGREWKSEPGERLREGWDPSVVRLMDDTYLMVYCVRREPGGTDQTMLVDAASYTVDAWNDSNLLAEGEGAVDDATDEMGEPEDGATAEMKDDAHVKFDTEDADGVEDDAMVLKEELSPTEQAADAIEDFFEVDPDGFAPLPDFENPVDYLEWYRSQVERPAWDNAWPLYDAIIPGPNDPPGSKPEWPEITDMLSELPGGTLPHPWDPAEHPEWEATYRAMGPLLAQFREATRRTDYAPPVSTNDEPLFEDMPALLGIMLPSLSHHRLLSKSMLSQAWRTENGRVPPERMRDALETVLRQANHVSQGSTLIEDLVGIAQRSLVQQSARAALRHRIFTGADLERALDTLRRFDRDDNDPMRMVRGEHAFAMDVTQFAHRHSEQGDMAERSTDMSDIMGVDFTSSDGMSAAQLRASVEAFDDYFREVGQQMRTGYPEVRARDIEASRENLLRTSALTEDLLPSMGRYYRLRGRSEAGRRATQLAYATHIFRERHGRWPETLSELPPEWGDTMRTDPFSGRDFCYRVEGDGVRIWSASENGIDDGGVHSPRWDDGVEPGQSDDHVFWPPQ